MPEAGKNHTAVLMGASGLVGSKLLHILLENSYYGLITVVTRRPLEIENPRLKVLLVEDFDRLSDWGEELVAEDYFCTLGTTIKKAVTAEAFRKVDLHYPLELAKIAGRSPDFKQYLVVTAAGTNINSPILYSYTKAELEAALCALDLPALKIFKPYLLLGKRREFRLGEEVGKIIVRLFSLFMLGLKRRVWSIKASEVAQAMYITAIRQEPGLSLLSNSDMLKLVKSKGI